MGSIKIYISYFLGDIPRSGNGNWNGIRETGFKHISNTSRIALGNREHLAELGYGTTDADAGVGIGLKRGIQKFDKKNII